MNKMLVVVFDQETAAAAGLQTLRQLHLDGELSLYAFGLMAKDAAGGVTVREDAGDNPVGTGIGLAVGGQVFRRGRGAMAETCFDHDVALCKAEVDELEDEARQAGDGAELKLQARLTAAQLRLEAAEQQAQQNAELIETEAAAKLA